MKYQRQYSQPFDHHVVVASSALTDTEVCITFHKSSKKFAERIGDELVCQMVCDNYSVCAGNQVELWLDGIDNLYLHAGGDDLQDMIIEIASNLGFEIVFTDKCEPPE